MRQAYAHGATLEAVADEGAPGAAITTALCGHWEHEPPCPLAPHHTGVVRDGDTVRLRILFATEPDRVDEVRRRIDEALAGGDWRLIESGCARVGASERDHARRLLKSRLA
ncbi:hypothetical protein ODJ79_35160 [Actinoplanes sp. KI2]|uniref:hypothetical protein n=1 Tax=Actinoplanes sp. KI2 TaxID=2983315 RepID=UPI0021D5C96B|nr:hypothetical protein [Actinoplanes sp. KI2]MCU7728981.1 hypothetical protein [Actinoplanes sp. KI2]